MIRFIGMVAMHRMVTLITFGKAQGFDRVESASIFCGPDAPKTWVGVYDPCIFRTY